MRIMTQLFAIIAIACLLIGCSEKPCEVKNSSVQIEVKKPCAKTEVKTTCTKSPASGEAAPLSVAEPKTEEIPATKPAKEKGKLIVVTDEANYQLNKDILSFISTRGVSVERMAPADFEKYKSEKYLLVLGGPSEGENLGNVVKQLLSPDEVAFVSQTGNKELYLKTDKYSSGQQIIVIAGYDSNATFRQFVNSKDKWWGYISSWFNIELSHDEVYGY